MVNGVNPSSNRKVLELSRKHPLIKPAFGFYPVHVAEEGLEKVRAELAWIAANKPFALGEVGLDYKEGDGGLRGDAQREAFREFIRLGKRLGVPLIVHSRKAEHDVLDLLEEEQAEKVVMHCFMGKRRLAERARDLGCSFSIPVLVVKLEQLQWLVRHVPLKRLLLETDAPYLSPGGGRNTPVNVRLSVEKIAELLGMTPEEVANQLFMNYQRLFL